MRKKRNMRKGFTLVEVIVVLVILAILAAILIPAMTGWIDKAKERRLITACRTCVLAAQTLAVEEYGEKGSATSVDEAAVKALAGVPGDASAISFNEAAVTQLTYTEDGESVTYTRDPTPTYTYGAGAGGGQAAFATLPASAAVSVIDEVKKNPDYASRELDSGAAASATSRVSALITTMQQQGVDLSKGNVAAWKYLPQGKDSNGEKAGPFFYWTDCDVAKLTAGDKIAVMRYNATSGSYVVFSARVTAKGTNEQPYNSFSEIVRISEDLPASEQTYDKMVTEYQTLKKDTAKYKNLSAEG